MSGVGPKLVITGPERGATSGDHSHEGSIGRLNQNAQFLQGIGREVPPVVRDNTLACAANAVPTTCRSPASVLRNNGQEPITCADRGFWEGVPHGRNASGYRVGRSLVHQGAGQPLTSRDFGLAGRLGAMGPLSGAAVRGWVTTTVRVRCPPRTLSRPAGGTRPWRVDPAAGSCRDRCLR